MRSATAPETMVAAVAQNINWYRKTNISGSCMPRKARTGLPMRPSTQGVPYCRA
jgi:hypothetical protein